MIIEPHPRRSPGALAVVSPTYYDNPAAYWFLQESCRQNNLTLVTYGLGQPYPWLRQAKIVELLRVLAEVDYPYVMVTDAGDSFITSDEYEIMAKFTQKCHDRVLMSAERSCWPQAALQPFYPAFDRYAFPWPFLNSGGYIGKRERVIEMLQMTNDPPCPDLGVRRSQDWENDQFLLSLVYLSGKSPIVLDTDCLVFQCMGDTPVDWFEYRQDRLVNNRTWAEPSVLHFNGHAPGMMAAFNNRFARSAWNAQPTIPS
jgi:hypothetical protein